MNYDLYTEQIMPSGIVTGINFSILDQAETEKLSVATIEAVNEVTDPRLGIPNLTSECSTCGARDTKQCEGHFGIIKFPCTILHPYFLPEVVKILNYICPACKSIRHDLWKGDDDITRQCKLKGCKYCAGFSSEWYPTMKFKVSSRDLFRKTTITVEVSEKLPRRLHNESSGVELPADYWDFIPKDEHCQEICSDPNKRVLSHAQVHYFLKDIDPEFIDKIASRTVSLFLSCFLVTPNCHRVSEAVHASLNGQRLSFDERTRAYRKLVDFRGTANELACRVLDCLKMSKLTSDNSSSKDSATNLSGSKWFKDVVLGKRSDHTFRMVVIGDPKIKLSEIGIPCNIAERLQICDNLNSWNWEKLTDFCNLRLFERGEVFVRRKNKLVRIGLMDDLEIGDTIFRPLNNGDIVLINRPPSIHQHSLIALSVKILPIKTVVSINPFVCPPLRGDFDGDCLHGYIPQTVSSKVELTELVTLDHQLINGQNGKNLLSFSQDSLTAAYLVTEDSQLLDLFQMQQLAMFCTCQLPLPAVSKACRTGKEYWTGKQLFSMLLPQDFNYSFSSEGVYISAGELLSSSEGSAWLRDSVGNLFYDIVKHCQGKTLDFLHVSQNVLCEWLSMRGLSVSLSDLYISSDRRSRQNLIGEVRSGLQEARQICDLEQLLVNSCFDFLVGNVEEYQSAMLLDKERLCYKRQKFAASSQASISAFKQFFRDIQGLVFQYSSRDNALLAMLKAGSKGNLLKLVQHTMCVGLQHSLVPLSFSLPYRLSCRMWNNQKFLSEHHKGHDTQCSESFIPYAVIENSFLTGLNPLESFVHSLTCRDSSFSDNADVPGTLTRRLMFFMRDIYIAYDGTVRNAHGNQVLQFPCSLPKDTSTPTCNNSTSQAYDLPPGQPVGSLSACAVSEAAYSALDLPISTLEISPLLNLKSVLECGLRKFSADQTVSLFLSKKLGRWVYGFESGALEVKNYLERLLFSDIVSCVMIHFSPQTCKRKQFSPWICHFHVCKERAKKRKLKLQSILASLDMACKSIPLETNASPPEVNITSKDCSCCVETSKEVNNMFCITVALLEVSKSSRIQLGTIRDVVIPALLKTVVKGFLEIKKVDVLWKDKLEVSKSQKSAGELYLRVHKSEQCKKTDFWSSVMSICLPIMNVIDWERSHPDDIYGVFLANGVDTAWRCFLFRLKSAIADIGKPIYIEHLLLIASCLSATGEFVGLNARGMAHQREETSVSSPFLQACFSNPSATFTKAAKGEVFDNLQGSVDALAWGRIPSVGTGGRFDIIYSGKGHEIDKPESVYSILGRQSSSQEQTLKKILLHDGQNVLEKYEVNPLYAHDGSVTKRFKRLEMISKSFLKTFISYDDILKLSQRIKSILHKYKIGEQITESDKDVLMTALYFHPRKEEKIGPGAQGIKIGHHGDHKSSRCFLLVRKDGTTEDFSYHKCILGALEIIAPCRAKRYQSKLSILSV